LQRRYQGLAPYINTSFEYEKALEYYERSIKLMPFDKVSYNEAALCCIKLNEPDKAKKLLFKALS
jgi:tetratricopeptide (TPR) repeat protein